MELVRKVTSHQSVEIVLERYFKPGRDDFIRALSEKMPRLFMLRAGRTASAPAACSIEADATVVAALESMTAENWREVRERILRDLIKMSPVTESEKTSVTAIK